eukprot:scaffold422239_cov98-Attheya_sp.AAC.1
MKVSQSYSANDRRRWGGRKAMLSQSRCWGRMKVAQSYSATARIWHRLWLFWLGKANGKRRPLHPM